MFGYWTRMMSYTLFCHSVTFTTNRNLLRSGGTVEVTVDCVWNVMAHSQKPNFFFRRNGRVHLNRRGRQFSRLLAAEVCASAVAMLDAPSSEVVWRVLATHSIRKFPLQFPSPTSPCVITFQLHSATRLNSGRYCVLPTLCVCLLGMFVTIKNDHVTGQH